jgi:hypothetical protein
MLGEEARDFVKSLPLSIRDLSEKTFDELKEFFDKNWGYITSLFL